MRMIAVSLSSDTTEHALRAFDTASCDSDVIELRIDLMKEYDLRRLIPARPCPVIVTNRPTREGGRFVGSERDRVRPLREAVNLGAEYIDIEDYAFGLLGDRSSSSSLIVSYHDFSAMPEDLDGLRRRLEAQGADAIKVAGMATRPEDALTALQLYESTSLPAISIAMGEHGLASRVLALRHANCLLTYCAPDTREAVAPGQIPVGTMQNVYLARSIGSETRAIGVASPVSVAKNLLADLNAGLRDQGLDVVAVPLRLARPDEIRLRTFAKGGFDGFWLMEGATVTKDAASSPVFASFLKGSLESTAAATVDEALSETVTHLSWPREFGQ